MPEMINSEWSWKSPIISKLLEKAAYRLGELNSFARLVPNIDLYIQLHVAKEAVVSSRIEGTQTNMNEALLPIDEIKPERKNDWLEVNNYIQAINAAILDLQKLPISSRLLKKTHKILLEGVRGEHTVLIDTIQRFKGLESPILIIWGLDTLDLAKFSELLYVGMTRAKSLLIVVAKSATCNAIEIPEI